MAALTPEQVRMADRVIVVGDSAFDEAGWAAPAISAFLADPAVRDYLETKLRQYTDDEAVQSRALFVGRHNLMRMMPAALQTLQDALDGPTYLRDADGTIVVDDKGRPKLLDPPPSATQVDAAAQVLDRIGLAPKQGPQAAGRAITLSMLTTKHGQKVTLTYEEGANAQQQTVTRERVRNYIAANGQKMLAVANKMLAAKVSPKAVPKLRTGKPAAPKPAKGKTDGDDQHGK